MLKGKKFDAFALIVGSVIILSLGKHYHWF